MTDIYLAVVSNRLDQFLPNIKANSKRQCVSHKLMVLDGSQGLNKARNRAIQMVARDVDCLLVFADDDDYLGAEFLREHSILSMSGRLCGKNIHWVEWPAGELTLHRPKEAHGLAPWVLAGTMGALVADWCFCPFPEHDAPGEEQSVCDLFRSNGGHVWSSSADHFVYRRGNWSHRYDVTREKFCARHGQPVAFEEVSDGNFESLWSGTATRGMRTSPAS